jgi:hypothetical protein
MSKPPSKSTSDVAGAPAEAQRSRRRHFTRADKQRLLCEVDGCDSPEQVERILLREGLPGSRLGMWRKQLAALAKASAKVPRLSREDRKRAITKLEREKAELQRELITARDLLARRKAEAEEPANEQRDSDAKRQCG